MPPKDPSDVADPADPPKKPGDPEMGDPVLSDADYGPGFERVPDRTDSNPIDPDYGDVRPNGESGHLDDKYAHPGTVSDGVVHMIEDPSAPYGRGDDGVPYSRDEWESRYTDEDGYPIYPGNDGGKLGSFVEFDNIADFKAHYGESLDRFGHDGGKFLSFPEMSFESRALPPSNLSASYSVFEIADRLPDGYRIEVSEIAPAFGRDGGGLQVRFLDPDGQPVSVASLLDGESPVLARPEPDAVTGSVPPLGSVDASAAEWATPRQALLEDGSTHEVWATHDVLSSLNDAEVRLEAIASGHGLSLPELHELIYERPVESLTPSEARSLLEIREAFTGPANGEIMQKMLSLSHAENYLDGTWKPAGLTGFVARAGDAAQLITTEQIFHGLGLDYVGNPFESGGTVGEMVALRFKKTDMLDIGVPMRDLGDAAGVPDLYHPGTMAVPGGTNPYLGNGFVGKGGDAIIPEYHVVAGKDALQDGAEMWRILPDGKESLMGVLQGGKWTRVAGG